MTPVVQLHVSPGHFLHISGRELRQEPTRSQFEDFSETAAALETTERHLTRARSGESTMARSSTQTLDDTQRLQIELEGLVWFNFGEAQDQKLLHSRGRYWSFCCCFMKLDQKGRRKRRQTDKRSAKHPGQKTAHRRQPVSPVSASSPRMGAILGFTRRFGLNELEKLWQMVSHGGNGTNQLQLRDSSNTPSSFYRESVGMLGRVP